MILPSHQTKENRMLNIAHWGWPQIVWLILIAISLGMEMMRHGEPRTGNHSVFPVIFGFGLIGTILLFGGFFR